MGCSKPDDPRANEESSKEAVRAVAQKYGEAIVKGDWAAVRALGTARYQADHTAEQLKAEFDDFNTKVSEGGPPLKFNAVQIDTGELPSSVAEAQDTYGIKNPPPISTWRGWVFAIIGEGKPGEVDRGFEVRLFVVDEAGQLRVGYSELGLNH